jgi:hypothetical protein
MGRSITSLFSLYILTPGRRIYALRRVDERVAAKQLPDLSPAIALAIEHDRKTLDLEAARSDRSTIEVRDHDGAVDRTLGTIQILISHFAAGDDATAEALLGTLFPNGLAAHVHLPHVEQAAANERVLKILESDAHKAWLDAHGVHPLIEELRSHHDAFEAALKARDSESVPSWDDIKRARARGQELYLEIVAQIIAQFRNEPELRDELLEPIRAQDLRSQHYRRQRRHVVDVNPDTGEELEPESDSGQQDGDGSSEPIDA